MQMCQQFTFLKKKNLTIKERLKNGGFMSLKNFKFDLEKYNVNLEIASYNTYQDFFEKYSKKICHFTGTKFMSQTILILTEKYPNFLKNKM